MADFRWSMVHARECLLSDPENGEARAREAIRRFLVEAGTPPQVAAKAEDALVALAFDAPWEKSPRTWQASVSPK